MPGDPDIGTDGLTTATAGYAPVVAVQTPQGRRVLAKGAYVAVRSLARYGDPRQPRANDEVVRNVSADGGRWTRVGPSFRPMELGMVQAADDGRTLYALTANDQRRRPGHVLRFVRDRSGTRWEDRSTGLGRVAQIIADPFNGDVIYAIDLGDLTTNTDDRLMVSTDGGQTWNPDAALEQVALAGGRFRIACGSGITIGFPGGSPDAATGGYRYQCTLAGMAFDPNRPLLRWAVLDPAGVAFSSDGGLTWRNLHVTQDTDRPLAAVFDAIPTSPARDGTLYVALQGHGLIKVQTEWGSL